MSETLLCPHRYERPIEVDVNQTVLFCHYLLDHPEPRHSFFTLAEVDRQQVAELRRESDGDRKPTRNEVEDVQCVLDWINSGDFDTVLEAILAAAHNRKRTIRGLRGFPDLERRMADRR